MPRVSVVIPCFNQGVYLAEAIDSVLAQTLRDYEIIIVDDGSTDRETIAILDNFQQPNTRVLRTANGGLATARNRGIAVAIGEYILPLDADDRIAPTFLESGVATLDRDPTVGVVYGLAEYFGARSGSWELPEFSPGRLLVENMVYCSALFRRQDWQRVGGYDRGMRFGWEDWDFWLSLHEIGVRFVRVSDVLFYYRVRQTSMTSSMRFWQKCLMMGRMVLKHHRLYARLAWWQFGGRFRGAACGA